MALSNDEKSKILTNDEKALDNSYKSPIEVLGVTKYLGRTNEIISKKLQFIMLDYQKIEKVESLEELEKLEATLKKNIKDLIPKIIEPITDEELILLDAADIKNIKEQIDRRSMKRMGIPENKIEELIDIEKEKMDKLITKQIENLKNGDIEDIEDFQ